jgi:hypothetical protein
MSKTLRKITKGGWEDDNGAVMVVDETKAKHEKRDEWCKGKKMKPYMRVDVSYKGKFKRGEHYSYSGGKFHKMGNTNQGTKTEIANANRSLKKGIRQQLKKELFKQLKQAQ